MTDPMTPATTGGEVRTCALCGRQAAVLGGGATGDNGEWLDLCHPNEGRDCYHEWTVYGVRPDGSMADRMPGLLGRYANELLRLADKEPHNA